MFEELGVDLLCNAWDGFNSTIFAYGQTGSGKSYSVTGYAGSPGMLPRVCQDLFAFTKKTASMKFEVQSTPSPSPLPLFFAAPPAAAPPSFALSHLYFKFNHEIS